MSRWIALLVIATLPLFLSTGCVAPVFHSPITISTRSITGQHANKLRTVTATSTSYFFILLPFPADPRDIYDDLLAEAEKAGGNAVVDVQVRSSNVFAWAFPAIVVNTVEATGTAAVVD